MESATRYSSRARPDGARPAILYHHECHRPHALLAPDRLARRTYGRSAM